MAFSKARLASIRRNVRDRRADRDGNQHTTDYTKPQIDAASLALSTRLKNSLGVLNNDIEGAARGVFTATDKAILFNEVVEEFVLERTGRTR